jgi:hypothetical protein
MKYLAIVGFVGASAASCILANSAANAGVLLRDVFVRPWCPNCADGEPTAALQTSSPQIASTAA